ncbi:PREDICTED: putative sodium-dependent multivitamin transporter [Wasmannia auropunctata]|uniref:putative sodium-dependent multivitamin transporter n=1 Tax=Wasmannia auropunctata TaxID=64793 RepID=UPI0005F093E2|nr:PREDICTED: putative sodium-dependent multivitamin transporter [Wasmannia auropunctata]
MEKDNFLLPACAISELDYKMAEIKTLGWIDYLVIAVMLCISTGIGIYYRFSGGRQKTVEEYFIANRSMSIVPVAIAMVATFLSAVTMLGVSAEIYTYGTQFVVISLSHLLGILIICYGFLPVFFKLQATSVYEYLEKRFGVRARMMVSFVCWVQMLLHSGIVLYAPSLALEATTGMSKTASIIIIGLVCAVYSSIGGIKAVLITDVFQSLLMFVAVFIIIGTAANDVGGLGQIWEIARQGQRLEFDRIDLDPTVRHTWCTLASDALRAEQSKLGRSEGNVLYLTQDISTRWNSTLDIHKFEKLAPILGTILASKDHKDGPQMLAGSHLKVVSEIIRLPEPFKEATLQISSDSNVTASIVLPLCHNVHDTLNEFKPITYSAMELKQNLLKEIEARFKRVYNFSILPQAEATLQLYKEIKDEAKQQDFFLP